MRNQKVNIKTQQEYDTAMARIDALMKVGEENLTNVQADELRELALAANAYEKRFIKFRYRRKRWKV